MVTVVGIVLLVLLIIAVAVGLMMGSAASADRSDIWTARAALVLVQLAALRAKRRSGAST